MKIITLARKLGTTEHISCVRQKARGLGLVTLEDLVNEAVARGCFHYMTVHEPPAQGLSEEQFSNEELALALLTIANPYDPWAIRVGVMMLSAETNDPAELARQAKFERSESVVRAIAQAALRYEPDNRFWHDLLNALPDSPDVPLDVLPTTLATFPCRALSPREPWVRQLGCAPEKSRCLAFRLDHAKM